MSESATSKFGMMQWGKEVLALNSTPMPIVYFDGAPTFSHFNGVIGVTLTVTGHVPNAEGGADICASTVAFLKCNIRAAMTLRAALDSALLLAQPVENPEGKAN
jgi:hypothetical protein